MLRDTGIDLSSLPSGQPVFSDDANERGAALMKYLSVFCQGAEINPNTGWTDPLSPDHQSHLTTVELNTEFEPQVLAIYEQFSIPSASRAMATALAAVRLMKMGAQALNPEISKALLMNAIQTGAKTVPA